MAGDNSDPEVSAGPGRDASPGTAFPLALAIATSILCFAAPLGVPAILYALSARNAQAAGATALARKRRRLSLVLSGLALVLGALIEAFALIRHLAAGFQ